MGGKGKGGGGCGVAKTTYQSPLPNLAKWEPHALGATFYMDHFSMVGGGGLRLPTNHLSQTLQSWSLVHCAQPFI